MNELLLIDQDGVLCDTMGAVFSQIEQDRGLRLTHNDVEDYWFKGMILPPGDIMEYMKQPGFYRDLDVITGAVRAVNRLREQYDVVVCTAPMKGAEFCEYEKREWLAKHFDNDFAEQAIVTTDKAKVLGKAIIEDNPHIEVPYQVIMFHQRWNRQAMRYPRMFGWSDIDVVQRVMK